MAVTLAQSASAASSAASPTSITPTLSGGSTAGNLLILAVCCTGTSPTITTPANWTLQVATVSATLALAVFTRINNPGNITAVAVTITATGGGAVASLCEFSRSIVAASVEATYAFQGAFGSFGLGPSAPLQIGELTFITFGYQAATLTTGQKTQNMSANVASAVSTNGTPNAQIANFWGENSGATALEAPNISVSIPAVTAGETLIRLTTADSSPLTNDLVSGQSGIYVPQFYQGSIGG